MIKHTSETTVTPALINARRCCAHEGASTRTGAQDNLLSSLCSRISSSPTSSFDNFTTFNFVCKWLQLLKELSKGLKVLERCCQLTVDVAPVTVEAISHFRLSGGATFSLFGFKLAWAVVASWEWGASSDVNAELRVPDQLRNLASSFTSSIFVFCVLSHVDCLESITRVPPAKGVVPQ